MEKLKRDEEYNYNINFEDGRTFANGHKNFGFTSSDSEVDAIRKIFDKYLDVSTSDTTAHIPEYKIDFSANVFDTMIICMNQKLNEAYEYFNNIEDELNDIHHRITKPALAGGSPLTVAEKIEIYDIQEKLLLKRRNIKDAISILKITLENIEKSRNFMLSMNRRMYSPKSDRFQSNKDFYINNVISRSNNVTRVDTSVKSS